jgi:hypothetical protein
LISNEEIIKGVEGRMTPDELERPGSYLDYMDGPQANWPAPDRPVCKLCHTRPGPDYPGLVLIGGDDNWHCSNQLDCQTRGALSSRRLMDSAEQITRDMWMDAAHPMRRPPGAGGIGMLRETVDRAWRAHDGLLSECLRVLRDEVGCISGGARMCDLDKIETGYGCEVCDLVYRLQCGGFTDDRD